MQHSQAFTIEYEGNVRCLLTDVKLISEGKNVTVKALWDTGATNSCISQSIAKQLKLKTTSFVPMQTASGKRHARQHLVNVVLLNDMIVQDVVVSEIKAQGFELLIGMDIISTGDFAISNYNGKTVFTFRRPSLGVFDFARQLPDSNAVSNN